MLPGISRSGSTIVGGMFAGLKRDTAFKYSFMLYIPMSLAAMVLELMNISIKSNLMLGYVLAILVSLIFTLLVTKWFRKIVTKGKLIYFSIYLDGQKIISIFCKEWFQCTFWFIEIWMTFH